MSYLWTADRILAAIREWDIEHCSPPTFTAWRGATLHTPSAQTVCERFGSWNVALAIAGCPTRKTGRRSLIGAA